MITDAAVLDRIFTLTRGDLDTAIFPLPRPAALLADTETVRILRMSSFWKGEGVMNALVQHTMALLAAFHAQNSHIAFALRGIDRNVECWIGAQRGQFTKQTLGSLLRGALPDCRVDETSSLLDRTQSHLCGTIVTGTPTLRHHDGRPLDQIESALRGLIGHDFLFLVHAVPRRPPLVAQSINNIASEIHDVRSTLLLSQSPMGGRDRTAERYVELLEAKLKRFELGRTQGMWDACVTFMSDTPATLNVGRGLLQSAFSGDDSLPDPLRACSCSPAASASPPLEPISSGDLAIFARPPQEEFPGYSIVEATRYGVDVTAAVISGSAIVIGDVIDRGADSGKELRIPAADLAKHALIVGVTGSGKTTTCMSLARQAWNRGRGVPFLIIESAKSEYRNLLQAEELAALRVFTVANEMVAPLRLNPFEVPDGVQVQTHIDYVNSLFAAAFVLYPPMPYVLQQSIQEIYEDRGWDLARNENRRGLSPRAFPRLADLSLKIAEVVDRMGYDTRITMDVKAGLLARVNQLRLGGGKGVMLDCRTSVPAAALFDAPCVLELKNLVSDDEKAFLIGLLLIRLYEHCETTRRRGGLQHVTVIEEAHRLLRNTSIEQGAESANPRGRAVEVFTNILSEVRAYGEGMVIVEQIPAKLTPDAIKNTGTKIVHRLFAQDDRELVGQAMNLNDEQTRGLALLGSGEAVAFTEQLQKPVLLRIRGVSGSARADVTDEQLKAAMSRHSVTAQRTCRACERQQTHCTATRLRLDAKEITESFSRFVNTLRFHFDGAGESFDAVARNFRLHNRADHGPLLCAMAALAEAACEARGTFFDWTFEDVDRAVDALLDDVESIMEGRPLSGRFAAACESLHAIERRPYAGCTICARACHYRFDVSSDRSAADEFRAAFVNKNISTVELVKICFRKAGDSIPRHAVADKRNAALCFAVMQLHRLQLAEHDQEQLTRKIADALGVIQ